MDAKTISEEAKVTLRFSLKILRKLVSANIIKSFKGTQGGYELARLSSEISLNDVIEAIEGTYSFCRCLYENYSCSGIGINGSLCNFKDVYEDISNVVTEKLKAVTFDRMLNRK
jgi:Rrf2 family protein